MMNKIKYFLAAVVAIGLIGGAMSVSAQTGGRVLVTAGGKTLRQSDVDKVIQFYEWVFQTEFTAGQRAQFQEIKEEEFRSDPAVAKKANDDLIDIHSRVKAKSRSEQEELRIEFNKSFIPELRAGTNDAQAQFLVKIYDGAGGGREEGENTAETNADNNSDDSNSDAVGDLSSVTGKWVWQRTGSGSYDSVSGGYLGGSGTRTTYEFSSNGAVTYTGVMNVMMGGCSQQTFLRQTGRAGISGGTMTIRWAPGTSTRDFSCDKAGNYTKTAAAVTESFPISFKTNSTGQRLFCMYADSSKETCFSPSR